MSRPDELTKMQWAFLAKMVQPALQKLASFWMECTPDERESLPYDKNDLDQIAGFVGYEIKWSDEAAVKDE